MLGGVIETAGVDVPGTAVVAGVAITLGDGTVGVLTAGIVARVGGTAVPPVGRGTSVVHATRLTRPVAQAQKVSRHLDIGFTRRAVSERGPSRIKRFELVGWRRGN